MKPTTLFPFLVILAVVRMGESRGKKVSEYMQEHDKHMHYEKAKFQELDANKDGFLTREEMEKDPEPHVVDTEDPLAQSISKEWPHIVKKRTDAYFQHGDTNKDEKLTIEEIEENLHEINKAQKSKEEHVEEALVDAKREFNRFDINKDNNVTKEEYVEAEMKEHKGEGVAMDAELLQYLHEEAAEYVKYYKGGGDGSSGVSWEEVAAKTKETAHHQNEDDEYDPDEVIHHTHVPEEL